MSKRSVWCDFDKETRKNIKKRDNNRCVVCGNNGALQIAHIFLSRAHGGKGSEKNGVLLCVSCHNTLDNHSPREKTTSERIRTLTERYLIEKENITNEDIKKLKFDKKMIKIDNFSEKSVKKEQKIQKRCKNCNFLIKKENSYSTISNYYCKYKRISVTKTTKACIKYKER